MTEPHPQDALKGLRSVWKDDYILGWDGRYFTAARRPRGWRRLLRLVPAWTPVVIFIAETADGMAGKIRRDIDERRAGR